MGAADMYRLSPSLGEHRAVEARVQALEANPGGGGGVGADWMYRVHTDSIPSTATTYTAAVGDYLVFRGSPSAQVTITLPASAVEGARVGVRRVSLAAADRYGFPGVATAGGSEIVRRVAVGEELIFAWRGGAWALAGSNTGAHPFGTVAAQDTTVPPAVTRLAPKELSAPARPDDTIHVFVDAVSAATASRSGGTHTTSVTTGVGADDSYGFSGATFQAEYTHTSSRACRVLIPLPAPVDLTSRALYVIARIDGTPSLTSLYVRAGNGPDMANCQQQTHDHDKALRGVFHRIGGNEWAQVGTGADLSAISHIELAVGAGSGTIRLQVAAVGSYRPYDRSAVVLCLDGVPAGKWGKDAEITSMLSRGVTRATVFPGLFNEVPVEQVRRLTDLGWTVGLRSLLNTSKNGAEAVGYDLAKETQEIVDLCARAGIPRPLVAGQWTNTGSMQMTPENIGVMRQYVYGVRRYHTARPPQRTVWPPVEPMSIASYGGTTMVDTQAVIDDAINTPGTLAVITLHHMAGNLTAIVDYVMGKVRAGLLDLLSFEDALTYRPHSVGYEAVPPGGTFTLTRQGGVWPARPSARADLVFRWRGVAPAPTVVGGGTGGMHAGDEFVEEMA